MKHALILGFALLSPMVLARSLEEDFGKDNIAVLDLTDRQVVCGYSDVNSDINRDMYADQVCQHFGHAASIAHQCGWTDAQPEGKPEVLTVDPKTGAPAILPFEREPGRSLGFYSYMVCVKRLPPEWRK